MEYTIVKNGVVDNVIEADEAFILEHFNDDIVVKGRYAKGYLFVDGHFISPNKIPVDVATIVQTTGYTGDLTVKPILPLTNLVISGEAVKKGAIYWLQKDVTATITANVSLPDDDYMLIAERVIDASTVVDDIRLKATVLNGTLTMGINFPVAGNYLISAKRLNEGLDRIGEPVNLSFDDMEFDIYI